MAGQDHAIDAEVMAIMQRYPDLFETGPWIQNRGVGYGFECDLGWYPLLERLFSDVDAIRREDDLTGIKVLQVKQKLGGLRIYVQRGNDRVHERLRQAEAEALETCESCGGTRRPDDTARSRPRDRTRNKG
ncbi:MAG: hypothetical protein LC676_19005 [Loktanella sp.]|nr:hypothetical protein [Loktanella sp.]